MIHWKPTYHFMAPQHWMNDPNGPLFVGGLYHVFYQWNPHDDHWGTIHWGHAVSQDLVHWEHRPAALSPDKDLGEVHCFSGCCVLDRGRPIIFYTSVGEGDRDCRVGPQQWMARGSANLDIWTRDPHNPVLDLSVHGDVEVLDWRDPFVWKEGEDWYMVLGGSIEGKGSVLFYRSQNLDRWEYGGILAQGEEGVWECPNFFRLGDLWLLFYSPTGGEESRVHYQLGSWEPGKPFVPHRTGIWDGGGKPGYYAPASFLDEKGRRLVHGWMSEEARARYPEALGWNGCLALPRVISLGDDGRVQQQPVPELEILREFYEHWVKIPVRGLHTLATQGRAVEIRMKVEAGSPSSPEVSLDLEILASADREQKTVVKLFPSQGRLLVDRSLSTCLSEMDLSPLEMEIPQGSLDLIIFVDHSTVEIFVNSEFCLAFRVYPDRRDCDRLFLTSSEAGAFHIHELEAWSLKSALS